VSNWYEGGRSWMGRVADIVPGLCRLIEGTNGLRFIVVSM
jgi:hypothetical protein